MDNILFTIWFFLPAAVANSTAVVAAKLPLLKEMNYPMDFHRKFRGERILGSHKTIRGLISGIVTACLVVYLQKNVFVEISNNFAEMNYENINTLLLGVLMGTGALLGDAVKSFFKRRRDIKPGGMWFPFDQIDYIFGSSIFTYLYIQLDWHYYLIYFIVGLAAHLVTNLTAYLLGIKEVPY